MKIYTKRTVLEAARERIRWVFDEFEDVVVSWSGGKDSAVILHLALEAARDLGRLPLPVLWLDQEAEWQAVVEITRETFASPELDPWWMQIPFRLFNATTPDQPWLNCWGPGEEWMRPQEPTAKTENRYGTDRFAPLFPAILEREWGPKSCYLTGVRCEESPTRSLGLTTYATYKHVTWGKAYSKPKDLYAFHPLYDWTFSDVWKTIHDANLPYCSIYDEMYRWGESLTRMRVSNVHHETAIHQLKYLHEIESDTWDALTKRVKGINSCAQLGKDFLPHTLPPMFKGWREYRDHLLQHLIRASAARDLFAHEFQRLDRTYKGMHHQEDLHRLECQVIATNDTEFTKVNNWERHPAVGHWRRYRDGKPPHPKDITNKYIHG